MSYITDVIVFDAAPEDVAALNEWLLEHDTARKQQLQNVQPALESAAGGTKFFVSKTWAAAFNYLPGGFIDKLRDEATWQHGPAAVVIGYEEEPYVEAFAFVFHESEDRVVRAAGPASDCCSPERPHLIARGGSVALPEGDHYVQPTPGPEGGSDG